MTNDLVRAGILNKERLVLFSDAVVAIAITLLALELPVPEGATNAEVLRAFGEHWHEYLAFLISFAVIATHWNVHHRLFAHVTALGGRLGLWNLLWLFSIIVTPFATRVLTADEAFTVPFVFYALVQVLAGCCLLLMQREIRRHGLRPKGPDLAAAQDGYARSLAFVGCFVLSIPVAFLTRWAYICWALMPVVSIVVRLVRRRRASV
ncbi:TMEM175 family protein [Tenggerimyces flavus]|uniref:TMEM175 family protein n=1 Tax=Tenggerimyces flavus TaxID=1708749 RepID=A0ABV7YGS8_9ACTN|nr:TMEM175 family protein [Tenggerimyces flavus]MBM7784247.1 putative membrane protein [Tenggerimyces flavus]